MTSKSARRLKRKLHKVKFQFRRIFKNILSFFFCNRMKSKKKNVNSCHKQGFKNTLSLSCFLKSFPFLIFPEQFLSVQAEEQIYSNFTCAWKNFILSATTALFEFILETIPLEIYIKTGLRQELHCVVNRSI